MLEKKICVFCKCAELEKYVCILSENIELEIFAREENMRIFKVCQAGGKYVHVSQEYLTEKECMEILKNIPRCDNEAPQTGVFKND